MHPLRGAWFSLKHKERKAAESGVDTEALVARLLKACHPKQRDFALDAALLICACLGRGCGKTTVARVKFLIQMLRTPKSECLFIATTRGQAEKFMWGPLKDLLDQLEVPAKFSEQKLVCTLLHNGSKLYLVGADNKAEIEKLRGLPFHLVGIDEAASYNNSLLENLFYRVIEPRLGDYDGALFMFGTPGHILAGLFYELTRGGSEMSKSWEDGDEEFWSFHRWTLQDGAKTIPAMAKLWKRALRNKRINNWSDDHPIWRREYLGFWAADDTENVFKYRAYLDDGAQWNQWDPKKNHLGFAILPEEFKEWAYSYGMDFGSKDPFALTIFAWSPQDPSKTLYHVFEFNQPGMYANTISKLLIGEDLDAKDPGGCIGHTGWPAAMVVDTAHLGDAFMEEMATIYGIRLLPAKKKDKHDAIELFNGDLIDGRIKVIKGSELATQLLTLQWSVDDYGFLKENKAQRNDQSDSAIYARREASHLLAEEPGPGSPYFPERPDMMEVPIVAEVDDEDDFGDMLDDNQYDHF